MSSSTQSLSKEKLLPLIQEGGLLSCHLKGFESRAQQEGMLSDVIDAYNEDQIALIEAGTGTGKSFAYLIPALIAASLHKERTVIATHTIALQEQLIQKDIPLLIKTLGITVKAVLAKGMSNYLCLRKLAEAQSEILLLPGKEGLELERIDAWSQTTKDGTRQSLDFSPLPAIWEKVCAEHDTCNNTACPHYQDCFFMKARKAAADAQVIVANHHLLFADVVRRAEEENYEQLSILPPYNRIVIDEAHHLEDIATDYFAARLNGMEMIRTISRLFSDRPNGKSLGKLPVLRDKLQTLELQENTPEVSALCDKLSFDIPGLRKEVLNHIQETFQIFGDFIHYVLEQPHSEQSSPETKLRILRQHISHPDWNARIAPAAHKLISNAANFITLIHGLESGVKSITNEKFQEQAKGILFEVKALAERLNGCVEAMKAFIDPEIPRTQVRWIETHPNKGPLSTHLINAELEIDKLLAKHLFGCFSTIILCSATLSADRKFEYIRKRLGLTQSLLGNKEITEKIYDSTFDFSAQALLAIPRNLPAPNHPLFLNQACDAIWNALQASRGNAFVLFTSYQMMQTCADKLKGKLEGQRYVMFKQGEEATQILLKKFKMTDRAVLFGTDSFWEGVDVAGEALRLVIIVKLPFRVPSEPIVQARTEAIVEKGGDPFMEYSLPNAVVKFKQGFGRLVRHKKDRGCVVCLDSRILLKAYGRQFLDSLPDCQRAFVDSSELFQQMNDFYRRTYHLTK